MRTLCLVLLATLFGCHENAPSANESESRSFSAPAPVQIVPASAGSLKGTLTGLAPGKSLVLENSAGEELMLAQNGPFDFSGSGLRVKANPEGQSCRVKDATVSCRAVQVW